MCLSNRFPDAADLGATSLRTTALNEHPHHLLLVHSSKHEQLFNKCFPGCSPQKSISKVFGLKCFYTRLTLQVQPFLIEKNKNKRLRCNCRIALQLALGEQNVKALPTIMESLKGTMRAWPLGWAWKAED